jgi:hypothetical protein
MAVPNLWRTKKQRYSLQAEVCPTCTQAVFPPRELCPYCHQAMDVVAGGRAVDHKLVLGAFLALPQATVGVPSGD